MWKKEEPFTPRKKMTKVTIKYNVGFNNTVFIRGEGADLSWKKGKPLKNVNADEWVWETDKPFMNCEFKVLINDEKYEAGENHHLQNGSQVSYSPKF
jgi:hypothetical protein